MREHALKVVITSLIFTFIIILPVSSALSTDEQSASEKYGHQDVPTSQLNKEHDITLKIAAAAEELAQRLQKGENVNRRRLVNMYDFFVNFVDACHHGKEEQYYFPIALIAEPRLKPIVTTLELHHTIGRALLNGVERSLVLWESMPEIAHREAADNLRAYTAMLRRHTDLESKFFMSQVEAALVPEQRHVIRSGFHYIEAEQLGEGFHEKYHKLAMNILNKGGSGE